MSNSKYLDSLNQEEHRNLTKKLFDKQNGKDEENNFGLTHESCNKSKQDADLRVARTLCTLEDIKNQTPNGETTSLKHVLQYYNGSKYDFKYKVNENVIEYSFPNIGDNNIYKSTIFEDKLSGEKSSFIEIPIEYIFMMG